MVAVGKDFSPTNVSQVMKLKCLLIFRFFSLVGGSTLSCVKASWMWPSPQCSL